MFHQMTSPPSPPTPPSPPSPPTPPSPPSPQLSDPGRSLGLGVWRPFHWWGVDREVYVQESASNEDLNFGFILE